MLDVHSVPTAKCRMNCRLQDLRDSTAFCGFVALFHMMPSKAKILATLGGFKCFGNDGNGEKEG